MDGRLLQYDEPRAFYDRPLTAAVARFFRNENLLPGVKQGARVETAAGAFTVCPDLPVRDGSVLLTVRPEHVVLNECGRANCVDAVVESAVFMGTHTQILLRFGGVRWVASAPATLQPQNGERIFVTLPEAHLWLIPT
jgi:ABC-type Fe3+/spermidine/putrescine transport system ATPase subunit